jgi:hypothetical protein
MRRRTAASAGGCLRFSVSDFLPALTAMNAATCRHSGGPRRSCAGVTRARRFDLDHLRAQQAQQVRGIRPAITWLKSTTAFRPAHCSFCFSNALRPAAVDRARTPRARIGTAAGRRFR